MALLLGPAITVHSPMLPLGEILPKMTREIGNILISPLI